MKWKWVTIIILSFVLFVFTLQNHETVRLRFLFWSFATSRAIVILASLVAGFIIGLTGCIINKNRR